MNILKKINLKSLSLEKIRELIRVNNEMPCLKFLLSSNGNIQILTPDKLGVYILAIDLLIADRLVYMMERPPELFVFLSGWNPDTKEYYDWRVRYEMESCR